MRKVSLVLGSGGARGLTQIGVISYLEEQGYEIDEVIGCSIGSIIGAAFAAGRLTDLDRWMRALTRTQVFRLMDFSDLRYGILKGDRVLSTLGSIVADQNIEDYAVRYTAVASDLLAHQDVLMRSGSVYQAIRASIAIPGIFSGVDIDNQFLVDGGVLNPLPINHVEHKDNIIIAVNLDGPPQHAVLTMLKKQKAVTVVQESYFAMRRKLTELSIELHQPDYVVHIPHDECGVWDFHRAAELVDRGYALAQEAIPPLKDVQQKDPISESCSSK